MLQWQSSSKMGRKRLQLTLVEDGGDMSLVKLFSLGSSIESRTLPGNPRVSPTTSAGLPSIGQLIMTTRRLLDNDPSLLYRNSRLTGCSPLHTAIRNYGNVSELIRLLIGRDNQCILLKHRNHYGDLPLHVAASVGGKTFQNIILLCLSEYYLTSFWLDTAVPMDVLHLVLARTLAATKSVPTEPDFLVWSTNHSGYTPIDLEWIRHIEAGNGFFSQRTFYPLDTAGIRKPGGRYDQLYSSLLRDSVDQVLQGPTREHGSRSIDTDKAFGLLLHRIFLIIRATFRDSFSRSPFDLSGDVLHQAAALSGPCGPILPLPILELILWQYPEQVVQRDHCGKLPLHHAVQVRKPSHFSSANAGSDWTQWVSLLVQQAPRACSMPDDLGRLPLHYAVGFSEASEAVDESLHFERNKVIQELTRALPQSVESRDPVSGLYPFMMAAACPHTSLESVFWLLRRSPGVAEQGRRMH